MEKEFQIDDANWAYFQDQLAQPRTFTQTGVDERAHVDRAWRMLGAKMGFDGLSRKESKKGERFVIATPIN